MIVSVFIILLSISLFLISLGYLVKENAYNIIGFFFIFLLSITIILPGNLEYKTGKTELYIYGDNFTGYHWDYDFSDPKYADGVFLFHKNTTDVYTSFDTSSAHWFGVWLSIISALGMVISLVEIKPLITGRND